MKRLGLGNVSLQSGRIAAAMVGGLAGVSREQLKAYIRVEKPGIAFTDKMFKRLK